MMTGFAGTMTSFELTEKGVELGFTGCGAGDVATLLHAFFLENAFKLESGDPMHGTYGTGSSVGRAIAGGFVKRAKYDVNVSAAEDGSIHAGVASAMSGAYGGVLGMMKERKQRARFVEGLKAYVSS